MKIGQKWTDSHTPRNRALLGPLQLPKPFPEEETTMNVNRYYGSPLVSHRFCSKMPYEHQGQQMIESLAQNSLAFIHLSTTRINVTLYMQY